MKLTIIGEENVYEQEVSQSMDVQDVIALIAAEVSYPMQQGVCSSRSGGTSSGFYPPFQRLGRTTLRRQQESR